MPKGNPLDRTVWKARWNKKAYQSFTFRLKREDEKDLIDWIRSQEKRNAYLVSLVREDMERRKGRKEG